MLLETFSTKSNPNVDRENGRLNGVVVMTTDFNLNKNAKFTEQNQIEIVNLGNSGVINCHLGHSKQNTTKDDLRYRIGYFEKFRVEGTAVKADLILSPSLDVNPFISDKVREYLFALAEHESETCGFSICVGMQYNDDDSVSIQRLSAIDLVEQPALTLAMFSKEEPTEIVQDKVMEDVHPTLNFAFDQFNALDTALKSGLPIADVLTALLSSLTSLQAVPEAETVEDAQEVETTPEPALEAPIEVDPVQAQIESLKSDIADMKSVVSDIADIKAAVMAFSKEEIKEEKKVVFSVNAPIVHERVISKDHHRAEYQNLRTEGKYSEAARYFADHLG